MQPFDNLVFVFGRPRDGVQIGKPVPQVQGLELSYGVLGVVLHAPKVGLEPCENARFGVEKLRPAAGSNPCAHW